MRFIRRAQGGYKAPTEQSQSLQLNSRRCSSDVVNEVYDWKLLENWPVRGPRLNWDFGSGGPSSQTPPTNAT